MQQFREGEKDGENLEALCMSKIRACTRSKKKDNITSLQGKNASSKVH